MAEKEPNELSVLRAEFKALTGKNPSPRLDADGVRAKIAEAQAAPASGEATAPAAKPKAAKRQRAAAAPAAAKAVATDAPIGTAYVSHPEGIGCSLRGVEIEPDKHGKLLVPLDGVEELQAHGFVVA